MPERDGAAARKRPQRRTRLALAALLAATLGGAGCTARAAPAPAPAAAPAPPAKPATSAEVLAATTAADWRELDPNSTLYLELPGGRVIIELVRDFAPRTIANLLELVKVHFFDGLFVVRVQDDYVVQWGDVDAKRPTGEAKRSIPAEFERSARDLHVTLLADPDTYAPQTGFLDGFPVGVDPRLGRAWLLHCYGMVGAGRDEDVDSGPGSELYAVIGQSPRDLDRNVTLLGRVVRGIELLSTLPRGTGDMGFYQKPAERIPIRSLRLASDVPPAQRTTLQILRTDTPAFTAWVAARRNRHESWFKVPAGHIDACNIPIPTRPPGLSRR